MTYPSENGPIHSMEAFRKIRRRTLALLGLLFLVFWVGLALFFVTVRENALQAARTHVFNMTRAFEKHTRATVASLDHVLLKARDKYQNDPAGFDPRIFLEKNRSLSGVSIQMGVIDKHGMLLTSTLSRPEKPVDLSDREHFRVHRNSGEDTLFVSKPVFGRVSGKWSLQFTRPLFDWHGAFDGVLVLSTDLDYFVGYYSSLELGTQGVVALLGQDGFVRARNRMNPGVLERQFDLDFHGVSAGADRRLHVVERVSPLDGVTRLSCFLPVKDYPLAVQVGLAVDDVLEPFRSQVDWAFPLGVGFSALLAWSVRLMLGRFHQDMLALREQERRIHHLAYHDALTGLPSRQLFLDRLGHAVSLARRQGHGLGVLFVDLDKFKAVNDTLGHQAGDALLQEVARRLESVVRDSDTVARLAGDEFVALMENAVSTEQVLAVAEKLRRLVATPMDILGRNVVVSASIGVSLFPGDGDDPDTLLRRADKAMCAVKKQGGDACRVYDLSLDGSALSSSSRARERSAPGREAPVPEA